MMWLMNAVGRRASRLLMAAQDPVSYRLLWNSIGNGLTPLPGEHFDNDLSVELGSPLDPPWPHSNLIPKIIFQPWTPKSDLPPNYAYWRRSFVLNNPSFKFFLWDGSDNRQFVAKWFPSLLSQYDSYSGEVFRTNLARLLFLYHHGGFSIHIDSECLKPLDDVRGGGADVLLSSMGRDAEFSHSIPNVFMASRPRQMFWLLACAMAIERFASLKNGEDRPEWSTGPVLLKDAADFYQTHGAEEVFERIAKSDPHLAGELANCDFGQVRIAPPSCFCPINWDSPATGFFRRRMLRRKGVFGRQLARRIFPQAHTVTYWCPPWG